MSSQTLFQLSAVAYDFHSQSRALEPLSLAVNQGEHLALLGANGAGKSTLLQLLAGLQRATSGSIEYLGRELSPQALNQSPEFRRQFRTAVGLLFQNPDSQLFCPTVQDEIAFGPLQIMGREEAFDRAFGMMHSLGIEHLAQEAPFALSGGERKKVALASVLVMNPDILLLDEPTANLDPSTCDFLLDHLLELSRQPSKTLIVATHDLQVAQELSVMAAVLAPCHNLVRYDTTEAILGDITLLRQMNLLSRRAGESRQQAQDCNLPQKIT